MLSIEPRVRIELTARLYKNRALPLSERGIELHCPDLRRTEGRLILQKLIYNSVAYHSTVIEIAKLGDSIFVQQPHPKANKYILASQDDSVKC